MSADRRVVVTGMGLRTPVGNTPAELSAALLSGKSGIRAMPEWSQVEHLRSQVAGVCSIDGQEAAIPRKFRRSMGRVGVLAALAAQDAVKDAGLDEAFVGSEQCGISFGSTAGSSQAQEDFLRQIFATRSLAGMQSSSYLQFMSHTCAANLAVMFGARGPLVASCTACTSGSQGVGYGYQAIRLGQAPVMLTGGAEEMHYMVGGIFDIMYATSSHYNDRPAETPRPFDARRDGLVVAEGSACLVLEELEHAKRRGARIHGEVLAYATNTNGTHMTNGDPRGIARVMQLALEQAGLAAERIDHVNAHATGTDTGDVAEAQATHEVFGTRTPVSGLKGYMGHTLGASGAIESVASLIMLNEGFIAPTRNLETPDPQCAPLGHVTGEPRPAKLSIVMNNNFAFGGVNTSLIFGKV